MIDLHVHSNYSDGTYTPKALLDYAMQKNLQAIALTDHDTIAGLDEMIAYADSLTRQDTDIVPGVTKVIPGIELSTEYEGRDIHLVGLFIDHHAKTFTAYLDHFIESRTKRNQKMCRLLFDAGIDISYEKLLAAFPNAVITRAHYGKYLLHHGYVTSIKEAFERYVGDRCPYFIPREKVTPMQAIDLIRSAHGIPILAHPVLYHMSDARLDALVAKLKESGLMGIETFYSTYHSYEERQMLALAKRYDLLPSGGSDFHGKNKPGLDLGTGYGSLCVPDWVLSKMQSII